MDAAPKSRGPMAGPKVIDRATAFAGPMAATLLGQPRPKGLIQADLADHPPHGIA